MKDSIRNTVSAFASKTLNAVLVWGLVLGPLLNLPSEARGEYKGRDSSAKHTRTRSVASARKLPFTQQDLVEIRAAAEREQIEETLDRAINEYSSLKTAKDFQGKFLKGLDAADTKRAKKHFETLAKLPPLTREGLVLKVGSGETSLTVDFTGLKERKLRFNGQVLYWHPQESLSTKMRYLQKKLSIETHASNPLLDLLFPRAHAVLPALAGAAGITLVLVGSGVANNIINWYATPILKLVDNVGCTLIIKAAGKGVTAWGPCTETVKGWEATAPAPEPVLNAAKDKEAMVELAKKFDELEEAADCDVKAGKAYTTKVMVKETKEVFSVKINLKIEGNGSSDGAVLTDASGKERAKLSMVNKNALGKAELNDKIVGTESGKMILALDATNKIDHLKPSEKAEWVNLEEMLKYLDPSIVGCFKKIRDAANAQQKKEEMKSGSSSGSSDDSSAADKGQK